MKSYVFDDRTSVTSRKFAERLGVGGIGGPAVAKAKLWQDYCIIAQVLSRLCPQGAANIEDALRRDIAARRFGV